MDVAPRPTERIAATRMAIINHDRLKAELLNFYCTAHWGFEVVAIEHNGRDGVAAVARTKPEVVLVSLDLPDAEVAEIIRTLAKASPFSKIIGQLTQCREYVLHQLSGTVYHGLFSDAEEGLVPLGQAIARVRQGLRTVSIGIEQRLNVLRTCHTSFPKLLSKREQQVLVCIAHAMTDGEIARHLNLAEETALSHRKKIMRKLSIHSTPKLIRYCMEKGFNCVPPPMMAQTVGVI